MIIKLHRVILLESLSELLLKLALSVHFPALHVLLTVLATTAVNTEVIKGHARDQKELDNSESHT